MAGWNFEKKEKEKERERENRAAVNRATWFHLQIFGREYRANSRGNGFRLLISLPLLPVVACRSSNLKNTFLPPRL